MGADESNLLGVWFSMGQIRPVCSFSSLLKLWSRTRPRRERGEKYRNGRHGASARPKTDGERPSDYFGSTLRRTVKNHRGFSPVSMSTILPHRLTRGVGVDYQVLALASGGIFAPVLRTFAQLPPQDVSAMGLVDCTRLLDPHRRHLESFLTTI